MYRVWYWAMVDRETDGRFIASIPDLGDLAAYGENEKDAVAHVGVLAADHVRAIMESGQPAPRARKAAELPSAIRSKEVGRSLIPVEVDERRPSRACHPMSARRSNGQASP
jgi:predicted RNase H-like HicB family nuclease